MYKLSQKSGNLDLPASVCKVPFSETQILKKNKAKVC